MKDKIKVGITHGDIGGISYEIIIKALLDTRITDLCTPIVYGSKTAANFYKRTIPDAGNFNFYYTNSVGNLSPKLPNLLICGDDTNLQVEPGVATPLAGQWAIASLNRAIKDLKEGLIDVLVTCPINKKNTKGEDFGFIGHTEYLAAQFDDTEPLMFMISENLRVGLVTMHIPLSEVTSEVTTEKVLEHIRMINRSLIRDFSIVKPKIAVLGLNPHSGDEGLLGMEEIDTIIPALKSAQYENILAYGPFAADGFFGSGAYTKFDAVLAMYHDQGLAPFKAIAFRDGVNFTAGLSAVRTSPAHGVGYDIAGKNVADASPMRAAIYAAMDILRSRRVFDEISANPLPFYPKTENRLGKDANVEDLQL
ncbi:4-hydroxythreonine-4-phosphate dehydrogenase [Mucinivorans hirudinis]|uniref:4-hydroxythreonine-4-phosphate dehydrogenase n=1 Tax=Mucinivorans hirudinis TaxID=1433126 RepID=A0A060R989_9BACT|nr:4-hydroxythreonine-4-phosphate dehydrogenase [Mucinivorans hirudinis]